jgi:hypothetical protein
MANTKKSTKTAKTTKTTKTSKPRRRKTKTPDLFVNSKEVAKEQDKLENLQISKRIIEDNIKGIIDTYNSKSVAGGSAERFLDKLPLDSLKEFSEFSSGKKRETSLGTMKLRTRLRKEKEEQEVQLSKLDSQIALGQIDLLLAKINYIVNKDKQV